MYYTMHLTIVKTWNESVVYFIFRKYETFLEGNVFRIFGPQPCTLYISLYNYKIDPISTKLQLLNIF
jgi:hypothetical protein